MSLSSFVKLHYLLRVNWKTFVWVDDNAKQPGICLQNKRKKSVRCYLPKTPHSATILDISNLFDIYHATKAAWETANSRGNTTGSHFIDIIIVVPIGNLHKLIRNSTGP